MFLIRDKLYPHQVDILEALKNGARYVVSQPRTGKTRPVIEFMRSQGQNILVLTKKAAISGWHSELEAMGVTGWTVCNYERVRTKGWDMGLEWDGLVLDEAHSVAKYPKPNLTAPLISKLLVKGPRVGVSATPCPESYSQLFHQAKALRLDLWREFKNFYAWHKAYGIPEQIRANGRMLETYKQVQPRAWDEFATFCSITDRQAVVSDFVEAEDCVVPIECPSALEMCATLKNEGILRVGGQVVVADTPLALAQKAQQICCGAVLDDEGEVVYVNDAKVEWLKMFSGRRIAVLCSFKAEVKAISRRWSSEGITDDIEAFRRGGWFVGSVQRFNSGVDLADAEALVFTSVPWSAVQYIQGRERLLRRDRTMVAPVYFPVIKGGIDERIFDVVAKGKKDFNSRLYR